ncbi:hypothetical protein FJN14_04195 [Alteromonas mediterranea]|uniref:nucleoside-diphosphate sugar epimerase/dehydratase n=1 Tax=Alteromonas mediterranea TaxID=314275 RepID=UPI00113265F4|nr:LicD family protein [Alteromonas mediterranea]QDG37697.1 hypothetical protein FJN14_04195 [Alteromonas mediterranea]
MKIKTILFGAGASAKAYITNCTDTREFVCIIDNDPNKHGQLIEGIGVCGPQELAHLHYDEIVITTQWAAEVEKQLLNELHVCAEKMTTPPKSHLKQQTPPFVNEPTRAFGRKIICALSDIAASSNVPLVLDFGTLLGIIRDDDIIEWDDDIDMSVPQGYFEQAVDVVEHFITEDNSGVKWQLEKTRDKNGRGVGLVLVFNDLNNALSNFKTTFSVREFKDKKSVHLPSLGMWFAPENHFRQTDTVVWRGSKLQVPYNAQEYLRFVYGDDWHTPKRNITFSDYANIQNVEFQTFLDAGICVVK